ncbi:MAG: exosome 3'-_5 exonuclease subunit ski4 (Csl4) [Cirrosporium novae-zelandiae]|nr:MAG: exosome 3'->5 exonuclease subunit ski4 (Csl4) [Cirrosporium novae-zelandiae]
MAAIHHNDSASTKIALPGQSLGACPTYRVGSGTHLFKNQIRSSIAGEKVIITATTINPSASNTGNNNHNNNHNSNTGAAASQYQPTISIPRSLTSTTNILPTVGISVYCTITRLGHNYATCAIQVVDNVALSSTYPALIRREDVRSTQIDTVVLSECFRVGDIVRAKVISLGDQSNYYLSTAGNELGVVMARSEGGKMMYPVSWKEMREEGGGKMEVRKVAKPN